MSVTYDFHFDIDAVMNKLHDREAIIARCEALGEQVTRCDIQTVGTEVIISIEKRIDREVAKFLRKVFDPTQYTDEVETWWPSDGGWRGKICIDIVGKPLVINGAWELLPTGNGCQYIMQYSPKTSIRLLGSQIEKLTAKQANVGFIKACDCIKHSLGG
jgi:hypothetical protein